ncbi:MAG: hypothetical protein KJO82_10175 [Gammaproteobacteria bacterium]|nr:hypothetical protein [Gammaproteobacteria bacterium]NNC76710.1 hypothetical protein [Woeseiaceae bacterium]
MRYHLSILTLFVLALPVQADDKYLSADETLGVFVGEWRLDLSADSATFGERGGDGTGTMVCNWSRKKEWVDCELDSHYEGIGSYALKMVLYKTRNDAEIGAFVTNSFGGGRLYIGRWVSQSRLVYLDAWIDPVNKWQYQRTTYTFSDNDEMGFEIEVSNDGVEFLPHSRGRYHRQ